ncbi:MAG: hypothetical protein GF355_09575 [Candidatus Eisenbacteria bacterium]|nr:hypothetical protein [Candidatus Eisenbacteria bacterium]
MTSLRQKQVVYGWTKGMVRNGGPASVPHDGIYEAKNVYIDASGAMVVRPGLRKWKTRPLSDPDITYRIGGMATTYQRTAATEAPRILVIGERFADGEVSLEVWAWRVGQRGPTNPVWHQIASGLRPSRLASTASIMEQIIIGYSRSDTPLIWDSRMDHMARPLTSAPDGNLVGNHLGRLVVTGSSSDPSGLYMSAVADVEDFGSSYAAYIDVNSGDGDRIVAIDTSFFGQLIVFKRRSIHKIQGSSSDPATGDPFRRTPISDRIGTIGPGTVARVGNDILFLSDRGIHALSATEKYGDVELANLSGDISDYFLQIPKDDLELARAIYDRSLGLVYFMMPSLTLVFDPIRKAWYEWDVRALAATSVFIDGIGSVVFGMDNEGDIFSLEEDQSFDDIRSGGDYIDGQIEWKISTGELNAGNPTSEKNWRDLRIHFSTTGGGNAEENPDAHFGFTVDREHLASAAREPLPGAPNNTFGFNPYGDIGWGDVPNYWYGIVTERGTATFSLDRYGVALRVHLWPYGPSSTVPIRLMGLEAEYLPVVPTRRLVRSGVAGG